MPHPELAVVLLAAGQGTRMKSRRPKVLHEIAGRPMLGYVLETVAALDPACSVVVLGPEFPEPEASLARLAPGLDPAPECVIQRERLGTGHALACAAEALRAFLAEAPDADLLVLFGDTPFLRPETLRAMQALRHAEPGADLVGLGFRPADPARYGRVVLDSGQRVERIVEWADADDSERAIELCFGGLLLGQAATLFELVERLSNDNAKSEYYLTEVFALARAAGKVGRILEAEPEEILGVDSRAALAVAEAVRQTQLRAAAMAGGATLVDPTTVWLSDDTRLAPDVVIEPGVVIGPGVAIAEGARIRAFSHIEGARIGPGAVVGPFARLRPGSELDSEVRVGNFVEVKAARLGEGAKANHLSYIGDAEIGAGANIGAGTITCNYDGIAKHRTTIGAGAFIGSNTALVAPVTVGPGAIIGAGSTITRDVEADAVAVARGAQSERKQAAKRFRATRQAAESKRRKTGG
ncbi:MAG TPA: bifunctional UDP-N-acetylglucosamine diphosphorylase/glucosamine-1-phosphate N-acetyltransferase GlmU [Kiloniellales bacterium]|nr:bifunctional UDP-N-acetylglucosamine diphosphorylase/glucosamine-1-phosphate N-acetyltransferase GlmU [Kiloniellales bacterium]